MNWESEVKSAETLLLSATIPPSEQIISAIERVNPTRLCLPDPDRLRGYEIKNRLQNLLLENYGDVFHIVPHPCASDVVLIKHLFLPSIDACHANLNALSARAIDSLGACRAGTKQKCDKPKANRRKNSGAVTPASPGESLRRARQLLDQYDYVGAEQELAALRVEGGGDVVTLVRGVRMLFEEMGAYQTAIQTLLAQGGRVLQEKSVRELLALAYHGNGSWAEAGAVFDALHPSDLGKDSLCAYAGLALRDGNLLFASKLLRLAREKEGFVAGLDNLGQEMEKALNAKAEPILAGAAAALARGDLEKAQSFAHEALSFSRNLPKARRVIALADAIQQQEEVADIWRELAACVEQKARVQLLERLLEMDKNSTDRINELLRSERESERRKLIDLRLDALRDALEGEKWQECFEAMTWLSRQEDAGQALSEAASLSPLLRVLHRNRRLERLSQHAAREFWLMFVAGRALSRAGRHEEALPLLTKARPYFGPYPEFGEEFARSLAAERAAATEAARKLLADATAEGSGYAEVCAISHAVRAVTAHLDPEERAAYLSAIDRRLEELRPRRTEQALLEEYETAGFMGDAVKASCLAGAIGKAEAIARIDAKIAEKLRVEAEPMALTVSDDLRVDLEREHPGLHYCWSTERHACLMLNGKTLVVIDLWEMTAWRYKLPAFRQLVLNDYLADKNLFLFGQDASDIFLRLVLNGAQSRITSVFELSADLWPGQLELFRLFLSSGKETEYYVVLKSSAAGKMDRMLRFSLCNARNPGAVLSLRDEEALDVQRASSDPDTFLLVTGTDKRLCNKNLVWPRKMPFAGPLYGIDRRTGNVYHLYEFLLACSNFKSHPVKSFPEAVSALFFTGRDVLGICPETETVFFKFKDQRGTFYNLSNNTFSSQVGLSTVIGTSIPGRWYYMECDEDYASMRLKDITNDLGDLLRWKALFYAGEHKDEYMVNLEKLREGVDLVGEG